MRTTNTTVLPLFLLTLSSIFLRFGLAFTGPAMTLLRNPTKSWINQSHSTGIFFRYNMIKKDHMDEFLLNDSFDEGIPHAISTSLKGESEDKIVVEKKNSKDNMFPSISDFASKFNHHHALFIGTLITTFALLFNPLPSFALQSGGRIGGSFKSSNRQSTVRTIAPSRSYNSGFRAGYYSRPSVSINPYYSPFYSPIYTPFWGGNYYSTPGLVVSRGPSFFDVFFLGALLVFTTTFFNTKTCVENVVSDFQSQNVLGPGYSVAKISVAVDVPRRNDPNSILSVLKRLSNTAETDSRVGLKMLTSQVALELLRRKDSIIASSVESTHVNNFNEAERKYNNMSIGERAKFERESVNIFGGVDYGNKSPFGSSVSGEATVAVVTIILSIEGDKTKLPTIKSNRDVEKALSTIAADSKVENCLLSAEILWTPEDASETLTKRDVIAEYPSLTYL